MFSMFYAPCAFLFVFSVRISSGPLVDCRLLIVIIMIIAMEKIVTWYVLLVFHYHYFFFLILGGCVARHSPPLIFPCPAGHKGD